MKESTEDTKVGKENNAHLHTIKKFELVEGYVNSWIHKLMNNPDCKEVVFIDCMCNNGIYQRCAANAPCFSYGDEAAQIFS